MTVVSKFEMVPTTCIEYVHPWVDSCVNGSAGLLVVSALDSFRIYSAVYIVSNFLFNKSNKVKRFLN